MALASSAPGESLPSFRNSVHGPGSDIRHDIVRTRATISALECNVESAHAMLFNIHRTMKGQEGSDGKNLLVSNTRAVSTAENMLTAAQAQAGSASSISNRSNLLTLHLAH